MEISLVFEGIPAPKNNEVCQSFHMFSVPCVDKAHVIVHIHGLISSWTAS